MPPVWQALSSIFCRVSDRTCVRPLNVAFYDATGGSCCSEGWVHIGSESVPCARAPGLNFPALNFEVLIAYSSSIAHPGLAAMSCLSPSRVQITPFDNSRALSKLPRSSEPFAVRLNPWRCTAHCSPRQLPQPSSACAPQVRPASGLYCRLCGPPSGSRSSRGTRASGATRRRSAIDGYRFAPSC